MIKKENRRDRSKRRHKRIRGKIHGTAGIPRLAVFRSLKHIYAQVIDDDLGRTIAAASTLEKDMRGSYGGNITAAKRAGELIAERAIQKGIKKVVFDRGGNLYHGRVAALASSAREKGLEF